MLMEVLVGFLFFFFLFFFNPHHHFGVSQREETAPGSDTKEASGGHALKHQPWFHSGGVVPESWRLTFTFSPVVFLRKTLAQFCQLKFPLYPARQASVFLSALTSRFTRHRTCFPELTSALGGHGVKKKQKALAQTASPDPQTALGVNNLHAGFLKVWLGKSLKVQGDIIQRQQVCLWL